jgi:hypothetical protein
MGNRPPDTKTSEKSQADQLMPSGESQGTGGGGGGGIQTLRIPLNKLQPPIVRQAREGATVDVRFQNNAYEVFWAGQLIGTVPGSFKPRLAPPTLHRATIVDLSPEPQREKVVIEVAL